MKYEKLREGIIQTNINDFPKTHPPTCPPSGQKSNEYWKKVSKEVIRDIVLANGFEVHWDEAEDIADAIIARLENEKKCG